MKERKLRNFLSYENLDRFPEKKKKKEFVYFSEQKTLNKACNLLESAVFSSRREISFCQCIVKNNFIKTETKNH